MKECLNCGVELHGLQEMFCSPKCKSTSRWSRMTEELKIIQRKKNRDRYQENKVNYLENKKKYYLDNKEEILIKNKKYKKDNPDTDNRYNLGIKGRYRDYKRGASKRNLCFELTLEQFSKYWENNCYYCGDKINGIGLDRINNDVGYKLDNILPCCGTCNIMRNRVRQQDFINQCIKITNNLK